MVGGFAFPRMSTYRLPRILGGDAYEESITKGQQTVFEVISIVATVIRTAISLFRLIWDVRKDLKQKSNRPHQG